MKIYLIEKLERLCRVIPPALFDYSEVKKKFRKDIDKYVQRHPGLPNDVGCNVDFTLYTNEESSILRAICLSLNNNAKRLLELNKSCSDQDQCHAPLNSKGMCSILRAICLSLINNAKRLLGLNKSCSDQDQYVIPNIIMVEFHPYDKEKEGGFLSNIELTLNYVYKVTIDPTHETLTQDEIISSPKVIQTGIKDLLVEKTGEMSYRITFLWKGETEVDYTIRSLKLLGTNTEEKIELAGTLLKGINHLSGKNGGCGGNRIRINTDVLPADFAWVEVLPDNQVRIKLRDNTVYADLDGVPLELNNPTPFYVNSILNIEGLCSLILK